MKRALIIITLVVSFLFATSLASACEPCPKILDFEETVRASDIVIIGQRTDSGNFNKEPNTINVRVLEVLRGDLEEQYIRVNSWDGMCAYGIIVEDDRKLVMFLEKNKEIYDAVSFGCSMKTLPVEENMVSINDEQVTIDAFVELLGPGSWRNIMFDELRDRTPATRYIISVIVLIGLLIFLMKERKL